MACIRKCKNSAGDYSGKWEALVYLGRHPDTGQLKYTTKTFDRESDAKKWATKQEGDKDKGLLRAATVSKQPLAKYLTETWLPAYRTQVRSAYNTEKTLGKWILNPRPDTPFLGKVPIDKLEVPSFDRLYVAMSEQGMGERGISHLHGILKKAFNDAVAKKLLVFNPVKGATIPKAEVKREIVDEHDEQEGDVEYLSREQAMRFLNVAKTDRLSALWHLLLDGGLRPGEAFALKWRHLDWQRGHIKVFGTLVRAGEVKPTKLVDGKWVVVNPDATGWKVRPPKTEAGKRSVPLSRATLAALKHWKVVQNKERMQLGPEWHDHGFIFTTEIGNPLGNNVGRAWIRILAAADGGKGDLGTWGPEPKKPRSGPMPERKFTPRFVLYVLRHTCATLALLDGIDLLTVSRRLGHANTGITSTFYGHVAAEHSGAVAESFDRLVASS